MTARPQLVPAAPAIPTRAPAYACVKGYVRVSTEKQARDQISPEVQRADCAAVAAKYGLTIGTADWIEDHKSGSSLQRLDDVVTYCSQHPQPPEAPGLIITYDWSRWGRFTRPGQARMFIEVLFRHGWHVQSVKEPLTGTFADGFILEAYALAATKYREDLSRRARDFMLRHARDEQRWMGRAPFGYRRDPNTGKLVLGNERDQRTVRRIFTRYREGATLRSIAHELRDDGIPGPFDAHTPRPAKDGTVSKVWRSCTIRALLANQVYIGTYRWYRRANGPTSDDKRKTRDGADWVLVEHAHPALIDQPTWDAVRQRLTRPGTRQRIRGTTPYLLTGLGKHARCGGELIGGGGRPPNKFYKCGECSGSRAQDTGDPGRKLTINQTRLEIAVIDRVDSHVAGLLKSGELASTLDRLLGVDASARAGRSALDKERRDLESQQARVLDAIAEGVIKKDSAKAKLHEIDARLARVEREVQELRLEPTRAELRAKRDRLMQLAGDLGKRIRRAPAPLARELLNYWLAGFVVHDAPRKGAEIRIDLSLRKVPEQLVKEKPGLRALGRRCSPAACPRRSPR